MLIGILVVMICGEAKAWIDRSILFLFVLRTLGQDWQISLSLSSFPYFLYESLQGPELVILFNLLKLNIYIVNLFIII